MKEKNVAAKKAFSKKRIIAVLIVLALVAVMIFSNPEVQKFLLEPSDIKLSFQTGASYDALAYGKGMLIVSGDGIRAVDSRGRESWSVVSSVTSPLVLTKGDYIMLADHRGTSVNVYEKDKIISQIKTEREILSAKMNKNGYVAAATEELGYKGAVHVFDKNGKEFFKWSSGSGYIGDIDIYSKNSIALAQLMTDKEQIYSRILIIEPDSETDAKCIAQVDGVVMKLKYKNNGGLIAVCDSGVYAFKKNGKQDYTIDFSGRTPVSCNIENENNMVFAFDSGLNNTVLESYSASGRLRGSYETNGEMISFDVNGECILSASMNGIVRTTPKGKEKSRMGIKRDVKSVRIFPGRDEFLSIGSGSAEIVKMK